MPKNLLAENETKEIKVKQIIRWISQTGMTDFSTGAWNVAEIDRYVSEWLDQGWKLFNTHFLGTTPEGFGVLYILIKE